MLGHTFAGIILQEATVPLLPNTTPGSILQYSRRLRHHQTWTRTMARNPLEEKAGALFLLSTFMPFTTFLHFQNHELRFMMALNRGLITLSHIVYNLEFGWPTANHLSTCIWRNLLNCHIILATNKSPRQQNVAHIITNIAQDKPWAHGPFPLACMHAHTCAEAEM